MAAKEHAQRLFFALWPGPALQAALAEVTRDAVRVAGGRPVPSENFHVTLVFLGAVAEARFADVMAIGGEVARKSVCGSSDVVFDVIEYWRKAKMICATARSRPSSASIPPSAGAPPAQSLAEALKSELTAAGFAPDLKPFRPHVTLARKVEHPIPAMDIEPVKWSFREFVLVESRTDPEGAVYSALGSFPLTTPQR